jgi:O-antigen/teichoic acid export membrane protein
LRTRRRSRRGRRGIARAGDLSRGVSFRLGASGATASSLVRVVRVGLARLATFRGYVLVVAGAASTRVLSFATAVILARVLSPASFGEASVFLAFLGMWVTGDFLDATFVRHATMPDPPFRRDAYLRAILFLKIALNGALLLLAAPAGRFLATTVFGKPALALPIAVALGCGVGLNFLSLYAANRQADERFGAFTAATTAFPFLVFLLVAAAIVLVPKVDLGWIYGAYGLSAAIVGAFAFVALARIAGGFAISAEVVRSVVSFSKWLFAANLVYLLFQRLDVFILTAFASLTDVGQYGVALRVVQVVAVLTGTLATALLPRASRAAHAPALLWTYLKQCAILSALIALAAVVAGLAAPLLVSAFFGAGYEAAASIVRVYLIGTLLVGIYTPLSQLLVAEAKPRRMMYLALVKLCVISGAGVLLVPRLGGVGAALALTLSEGAALAYVVIALRDRIAAAWRAPALEAAPAE